MNQLPIAPHNGAKMNNNTKNAENITALTPKQGADLENYFKSIDNLAAFGLFNSEKAAQIKQNLMNEMVKNKKTAQEPEMSALEEFLSENPEFFSNRANLKNYLETVGVELDKEEFSKIAKLIEELENSAVNRFAQSSVYGDMLKEHNELAKNRLNTLSARGVGGSVDVNKVYTPDEIGKMSSREFKAKEALINEQMLKRLV